MLKIPKKTNMNTAAQILMKRGFSENDISTQIRRDETGLNGELYLSKIFETELLVKPIILYGVRLAVDEKECQIDCLMIFQNKCILIEVKNYTGDYLLDRGKFYFVSNKEEIDSPLEQLDRATRIFKRFLKEVRMDFEVVSRLVFTGQEFQLYHSDLNQSIIHPGQIKRFIRKLNNEACYINERHRKLEELIYSRHLVFSSYEKKYDYDYSQLDKKMSCESCNGEMKCDNRLVMKCVKCGAYEQVETAFLRNVLEFVRLFPEIPITTSQIYDWIGGSISKYRIRTYLGRNFDKKGENKNRSFVKR